MTQGVACDHGPRWVTAAKAAMIAAWMVVATPLGADDASNVRFAPAGPATTEPALVDTPQHAVVFLSPTDTRHIWLVRLLPKEAV